MHHPIFAKFECWKGYVRPGFTANFLGVLTRQSFFKKLIRHDEGRFVQTEFPDFAEVYLEWLDLLEAVTTAEGQFTIVELGAGWGKWMVNAVATLRQYDGRPYKLIGVEPEPDHFAWMLLHFRDNGINPNDHCLIQAAVADHDGWVWFYIGRPDEWYGQAIAPPPDPGPGRLSKSLLKRRSFVNEGMVGGERVKRVKAVSLNTLLKPLNKVDLIDLDVQGAELTVLQAAAERVDQKVRRVHIGTHSAEIEAGLRSLFHDLGWEKLHDYPCQSESATPWGTIEFQDGVQSWVNPKV